jgi:hypothetical protein
MSKVIAVRGAFRRNSVAVERWPIHLNWRRHGPLGNFDISGIFYL